MAYGSISAGQSTVQDAKRILIADDTASSRVLLREILEASHYHVAEAEDGEQVCDAAEAFDPHLVILDLQMPRLDGYATVAALRSRSRLRKVPVVAMTAAITQTPPRAIAEAGFSAYLVKPIAPIKLRQCVFALLYPV